jgi:hypothetical protein
MSALPRGTGPVVIDGRTVYGLFIRLPKGLRLRVDEWDICDGARVRVAIPPGQPCPYYVHAATWVDGSGYWVELVDAPAVPTGGANGKPGTAAKAAADRMPWAVG